MKRFPALFVLSVLALSPTRGDAPNTEAVVTGATNAFAVLEKFRIGVDPEAAQRAVIEAIFRVADPSARIMTRAAYDHMMAERNGIDFSTGLRISMTNGQPRVLAVPADSPAAEAGLRAGDVITRINGITIERSDIATCSSLLRGHTGGTVRVEFTRGDVTTNEAAITMKPTKLDAIETAEELSDQLAYLRLNGLFAGTGKEVVSTLRGWAETGRFGVVLDLRGATGGDLESVVEIASLLAPSETRLYGFKNREGQDLEVQRSSVGTPVSMPVMVLVDGNTVGAPEVLAAVMAESLRGAMVVGQETYGDPMVREPVDLSSGDVVYIATRQLSITDEVTHAGRGGVIPDIVVTPTKRTAPDYEPELQSSERRILLEKELADRALRDRLRGDETFQRAIDVLLGLKALNIRGIAITPDTTD